MEQIEDEGIIIIILDSDSEDKTEGSTIETLFQNTKIKTEIVDANEDVIQEIHDFMKEPVESKNTFEVEVSYPLVKEDDDGLMPAGEKQRFNANREHMVSSICLLKYEQPDLFQDHRALIRTIAGMMSQQIPPPLPEVIHHKNEEKMLVCLWCSHLSKTVMAGQRHYRQTHGKRYLSCLACGFRFRSNTNLYKHEHVCKSMGADAMREARRLLLDRFGKNGQRREQYNCSFCHLTLPIHEMLEHEYTHGEDPPKKRKHKPGIVTQFFCSLCSAKFKHKHSLQSHLNAHRGERPYICSKCPRAYTARSILTRHMLSHEKVKCICEYCGLVLYRKQGMIDHIKRHIEGKKYKCKMCERGFTQRHALDLHTYKHLGLPNPFPCTQCDRRFARMFLLKKHMQKKHGLSILTKKMFFNKLPMLTSLEAETAAIVVKKNALDNTFYIEDDNVIIDPVE